MRLLWLPSSQSVPDEEIASLLTESEKARASEIKATRRREEYERSRWLLRKATGYRDELPRKPSGAPSWPEGCVGSFTHKEGHVALTLARKSDWSSVGIDCEACARLKPEFASRLVDDAEEALLAEIGARHGFSETDLLAATFAFKEALFKSHYPLGERMFWFLDARIVSWEALARGSQAARVRAEVKLDTSPMTPKGSVTEGWVVWHEEGGRRYVLAGAAVPT